MDEKSVANVLFKRRLISSCFLSVSLDLPMKFVGGRRMRILTALFFCGIFAISWSPQQVAAQSTAPTAGGWTRLGNFTGIVPSQLANRTCDYRIALDKSVLKGKITKWNEYFYLPLTGADYENYAPEIQESHWSFNFDLPLHRLDQLLEQASEGKPADDAKFIAEANAQAGNFPNAHCYVSFQYLEGKASSGALSLQCSGQSYGQRATGFNLVTFLDKSKVALGRNCR